MIANKRIFYIDSHNKIDGTDSDFSISVPIPTTERFDSVVVLSATIPKSYYLIAAPYNTFILREIGVNTVVSITPGNYSVNTFKNIVAALMTAASPNLFTYTISFPTSSQVQTGKFAYSVSGNGINQPSIILYNFLYEQFGFLNNSTNTFIANSIVSTNVVKFQIEDCLFIKSDICTNGQDNILQDIQSSGSSDFSNIQYKLTADVECYSKRISSQDKNIYRFTLVSEDNTAIDLQGLNMTLTLLIYNRNDIYDIIKKFMIFTMNQQE